MLAIRMQRTGRKGHAMFRVVVQDSRRTPSSGKVVMLLGSYDPHAKTISIDKEKAAFYLEHGAQPSDRVVRLLTSEGVKFPAWVTAASTKSRTVRHADKRRSTTPAAPAEETVAEEPAAETPEPEVVEETPAATAEVAETSEPATAPEASEDEAEKA